MLEKKNNNQVNEKYNIERQAFAVNPELARTIRKIERKSKKLRKIKITCALELEI